MTARKKKDERLTVGGAIWLTVGGESFGGKARIELLRAIVEKGSITHAAKAVGISYKSAWDAIDTMNTLAGEPLVARSTGGRGGGSTRLTPRGLRLVERFGQIDAVHQRFLKLLDDESIDLDREFSLLRTLNLRTSARNQWVGTVTALRAGAVNDEIELALAGGNRLAAIVTRESTAALGLRIQQTVIALVKSSSVLLATDIGAARISARNRYDGEVRAVTPGSVNAEVAIHAANGLEVVAVVSQAAVAELGLAPGARVTALVKASDVILAVAT